LNYLNNKLASILKVFESDRNKFISLFKILLLETPYRKHYQQFKYILSQFFNIIYNHCLKYDQYIEAVQLLVDNLIDPFGKETSGGILFNITNVEALEYCRQKYGSDEFLNIPCTQVPNEKITGPRDPISPAFFNAVRLIPYIQYIDLNRKCPVSGATFLHQLLAEKNLCIKNY